MVQIEFLRRINPIALTISILIVVGMGLLSWCFYLNLRQAGLRAEAKIMLNYISTLQAAHYTDTGRYAEFSEPYGAQILGRENCVRPDGALDLGFTLNGCNRTPERGGLRYAFRVVAGVNPETLQPDLQFGYVAYAESGSDLNGVDFVCGDVNKQDTWSLAAHQDPHHVKKCL